MVIPHASTQIEMLEDLLTREFKFFRGDICRVNADWYSREEKKVLIRYPYFYRIEGEQTYLTKETPTPFKESELELIANNTEGVEQTKDFFKAIMKRLKNQLGMTD